ncbi:cation-transporting P-type ATPase A/B [Actinopolyspora lacussalsi subsp. righensis]|uniref:Cation-transporting P-type ATPase B n=1 Tax=Actinopolyspora righensis TaxID=995060 RepID=A0A1I7BY67_9ACTN|nr:cation-translocating P-type ATPase [Actinopolyspora righensis]SFT92097.1 cation-transporting P-type ATPase A/B [Actinopolyspora righensis]
MTSVAPSEESHSEGYSVDLAVTGMTCAACATRVQRKLNKLDGVSASVNYATEKATVEAPSGVAVERLLRQVETAGYGAEVIRPDSQQDGDPADRVRYLWRRLVVALLCGVPLADLSITLALTPSLRFPGWSWVLLALTLPVATWCAWPFHRQALVQARHGTTSMDTLVSIGILVSACWSGYTIFAYRGTTAGDQGLTGLLLEPAGSVYLDVAAAVTIFMLAGRLLEAKAKQRAGGALHALAALGAKDVAVLDRDGNESRVPVERLRREDHFTVRPGETVATDGEVLRGHGTVDTSAMSGEPVPVEASAGDAVVGGTILTSGRLVVRATRVGEETQLARLRGLVERAQHDKARTQRLADRISGWFVPAVGVLAALTLLSWWLLDAPPERAFSAALTVLIIACPCALGLATPTALLAATGRGAQLGIFIKGHRALESARAIDTVVLDKTGTLTTGRMAVVDLRTTADTDTATVLRLAGAVEDACEHAVARAISSLAGNELGQPEPVTDFTSLSGLGAAGTVAGRSVLVGSARLLRERGSELPEELEARRVAWESQGRTTVAVAVDGQARGIFALTDTVKPSAARMVGELHRLGLRTVLLSGDNTATVRAVAERVGIDETLAEVLPADKAATIAGLREQGRTVAMVGDGINDAPALAGADLGIAVISGTDVALDAADLLLVRDRLEVVPESITLARRTLRTIRGNLAWAFGYNLAALPLAALGLLNPLIAAAAMALSSLFVVTNSLRLRRFGTESPRREATPEESSTDGSPVDGTRAGNAATP